METLNIGQRKLLRAAILQLLKITFQFICLLYFINEYVTRNEQQKYTYNECFVVDEYTNPQKYPVYQK